MRVVGALNCLRQLPAPFSVFVSVPSHFTFYIALGIYCSLGVRASTLHGLSANRRGCEGARCRESKLCRSVIMCRRRVADLCTAALIL